MEAHTEAARYENIEFNVSFVGPAKEKNNNNNEYFYKVILYESHNAKLNILTPVCRSAIQLIEFTIPELYGLLNQRL